MSKAKTIIALSIVAIFCSVATAGAARHYLITSTKQIKPNVMRALKGNAGAQGPRGFNGAQGTQGIAGAAGITQVFDVIGNDVSAAPGQVVFSDAVCPAGSAVVGTGFYTSIASVAFAERFGNIVRVAADNESSIVINGIHAQAVCAAGPGVSARSVVRPDYKAADAALAAVKAAR